MLTSFLGKRNKFRRVFSSFIPFLFKMLSRFIKTESRMLFAKGWREAVMESFFFFAILFIHEREAETQAEGEAGSMQGAHGETRPRISRITPWAEGGAKPLSHRGHPMGSF